MLKNVPEGRPVTWCFDLKRGQQFCDYGFPIGCFVSATSNINKNLCASILGVSFFALLQYQFPIKSNCCSSCVNYEINYIYVLHLILCRFRYLQNCWSSILIMCLIIWNLESSTILSKLETGNFFPTLKLAESWVCPLELFVFFILLYDGSFFFQAVKFTPRSVKHDKYPFKVVGCDSPNELMGISVNSVPSELNVTYSYSVKFQVCIEIICN